MKKQSIKTVSFYFFIFYQALFLSFGCSSANNSTKQNAAPIVYENTRVFHRSSKAVYESLLSIYQKRGYVITLTDHESGLINGEYYATSSLPNEETQQESTVSPVLIILSFLLLVGFIFLLVGAFSSNSDSNTKNEEEEFNHRHEHSATLEPTTGYKYVVSSTVKALNDSTSKVELNLTQITYTNGSPAGSINYKHAGFVKSFFDALEGELYFSTKK